MIDHSGFYNVYFIKDVNIFVRKPMHFLESFNDYQYYLSF